MISIFQGTPATDRCDSCKTEGQIDDQSVAMGQVKNLTGQHRPQQITQSGAGIERADDGRYGFAAKQFHANGWQQGHDAAVAQAKAQGKEVLNTNIPQHLF